MVVKEREHCLCWWERRTSKITHQEQLNNIGIKASEAPSHISGQQDNNIVNCTTRGMGVQIELTTSLQNFFQK